MSARNSTKYERNVNIMANVGIMGAGSWGTALALLLHKNGHNVTVWSINEDEVKMLSTKREHESKLPGVKIPDDMEFTSQMESAIKGKDFIVLAVPSPFTRSTARNMKPYVAEGQIIVDVAKGIEESTLMTLSQQIEEEIPQANVAVLSGPSHAEEVGRGLPTIVVIGAKTKETAEYLQDMFMNEVFRVYTSPDMLGMELGGSLKNVIALAAGIIWKLSNSAKKPTCPKFTPRIGTLVQCTSSAARRMVPSPPSTTTISVRSETTGGCLPKSGASILSMIDTSKPAWVSCPTASSTTVPLSLRRLCVTTTA